MKQVQGCRVPDGSPKQQGPARQRGCGLFPLPALTHSQCPLEASLSRRQLRRFLRCVNDVICGLNWMHGEPRRPLRDGGVPAASARHVQGLISEVQRVLGLSREWFDIDSALDETGAFNELLKGRSPYGESGSINLASYQYSLVSVPDDTSSCVDLRQMTPEEASYFFGRF